jgi:catechol 2,3-dioxygenase-like lactoylglutathione lyase family enzyme
MKTVAPSEIGVVAADIDALLAFYVGVLGMRVVGDIKVPAATSRRTGLAPDGYRVVRLETDGGDRIKLARPIAGPQPGPRGDYAMQRRGATYLTLIVDDVRSLHARLIAAGVALRSEGVVELRPGVWLVLATDPEGNFIEFLQYDDLASYRPPKETA